MAHLWFTISCGCTLALQQSHCKRCCHRNVCLNPPPPHPPPFSFLLLHALKYWCVSVYAISVWEIFASNGWTSRMFTVCKNCAALLKNTKQNKITKTTWRLGRGAISVLGTLFPSHSAFLDSLPHTAPLFVTFWKRHVLLLTSPPLLLRSLSLNTSPCLGFITTLLLSPNPPPPPPPRWCYLSQQHPK